MVRNAGKYTLQLWTTINKSEPVDQTASQTEATVLLMHQHNNPRHFPEDIRFELIHLVSAVVILWLRHSADEHEVMGSIPCHGGHIPITGEYKKFSHTYI